MTILLVYATNSGGTQLASEIVSQTLTKKGHTVVVKNVKEVNPVEFDSSEVVILASPSWDYQGKEGQPHEDYLPFMEQFTGKSYGGKSFAVFGLGDKSYTEFCGAIDVLEEFVKKLQGQLVVEPLKINGFYFDQENNTKLLTDWAEKLASAIAT